MSIEISVSEMKRVSLMEVAGRVDSISADDLHQALAQAIDDGRTKLVVNLEQVEYMSSAGLRELVSALKQVNKMNGDLRLAAPSQKVMEVLELAGLDTIFKVYPSTVEAVGSF
ncbi:MAG: STAS domain-containing protein [Anaerolineales bacterium]